MPTENQVITRIVFQPLFSSSADSSAGVGEFRFDRHETASCATMIPQIERSWPRGRETPAKRCLLNSFYAGKPRGLGRLGKKAGADGVGGELAQLFAGESLLGVRQQVLVGHIGAEEGRIV